MADFTEEQIEFLNHDPRERARLIAGPGAGKSFTCVAYMEQRSKSGSPRIGMLTFTRAATAEFAHKMQERGLGEGIKAPSTIHSFALSILRKAQWNGIPQPIRIADDWEAKELVRPQISRLLRAQGQDDATPSKVEDLEQDMSAGFESLTEPLESQLNPALRHAYQGLWEQHRNRLGYTLRSELPYRAGRAVEDLGVPDLGLDLLLVDEYQDLNKADIKLLKLIADSGVPVVAIGDEDQSIYSFRHAAPEGIRNFLDEFETQNDYRLTVSRRCGAEILKAAQDLIESAPGRPRQERIKPYDESNPGVIAYLRFGNQTAEANAVAAIVAGRIAAGVTAREIAILVRSSVGAWQQYLAPSLAQRQIAVASAAWVEEALRDDVLRRARALALLSLDINDSLAWMTLLHLEPGVGGTTLDQMYNATRPTETLSATMHRLREEDLHGFSGGKIARLRTFVTTVFEQVAAFTVPEDPPENGWGAWMIERTQNLSENAQRLLRLVAGKAPADTTLGAFLGQLEPLGKDFALSEQDAVRFMSMATSKGLTFNTTIIVGTENDIIPLPRANPDEERRLLYVAMTRATDFCILTLCVRRRGPIARRGQQNLGGRTRSPLLDGVLEPTDGTTWAHEHGFDQGVVG